mmetsp:Transcript_37158/g.80004  ORF Transcript_37158/g.80004 Transcript_37158/m.80004 type:complete len:220 (+) Transcript_37158:362-1021(+)
MRPLERHSHDLLLQQDLFGLWHLWHWHHGHHWRHLPLWLLGLRRRHQAVARNGGGRRIVLVARQRARLKHHTPGSPFFGRILGLPRECGGKVQLLQPLHFSTEICHRPKGHCLLGCLRFSPQPHQILLALRGLHGLEVLVAIGGLNLSQRGQELVGLLHQDGQWPAPKLSLHLHGKIAGVFSHHQQLYSPAHLQAITMPQWLRGGAIHGSAVHKESMPL